jgi:glucoamylase
MEAFSYGIGLIPEQVWDAGPIPSRHMYPGGPTGSVIPLAWAHAEYLKLRRSAADGRVFDLVEPVAARYRDRQEQSEPLEIWRSNRQVRQVPTGSRLRVLAGARFLLHWSGDDWHQTNDTLSQSTPLGIEFADIRLPMTASAPLRFTFLWLDTNRWEGKNYSIALRARSAEENRMGEAAYGEYADQVA